jgi:transposase InsO family protein
MVLRIECLLSMPRRLTVSRELLRYNRQRRHSALGYDNPAQWFSSSAHR